MAIHPEIIEELRTAFNDAVGSVRVISFLSPTCGPCRYGQGVVRALFEQFSDEQLAGYVIWVPMLQGDNFDSAQVEQHAIVDPRLHCWFDGDKEAANAWSSFIGLPSTTWDVYAIYDASARWADREAPPTRRIWMHQLNTTPATKRVDRLDATRLARSWLELLGKDGGRVDELAAALHASGQAVSARDGSPPHDPAAWAKALDHGSACV